MEIFQHFYTPGIVYPIAAGVRRFDLSQRFGVGNLKLLVGGDPIRQTSYSTFLFESQAAEGRFLRPIQIDIGHDVVRLKVESKSLNKF